MTRPSHVRLHAILTAVFAGFLTIAACIAVAAAVSLLARGTPLSGMWDSKESSYHELLRHRFVFGAGFILLAACPGRSGGGSREYAAAVVRTRWCQATSSARLWPS